MKLLSQPIDPHAFSPHHIYLQFRPEFVAALISGLCDIVRNCHQVKFVSFGLGTRIPQRDIIAVCLAVRPFQRLSVRPSIRTLVADLVVKVRELMHILCVLSVRLAVCLLICLWFIDNRQRTKLSSGA